jgi:membrane associated rhomboid family serine protease
MPLKRYDPDTNMSRKVGAAASGGGGFSYLTALVCVLCIALTAAYHLTGRDGPRWGNFPAPVVWGGQYGALVTTTFLHGDIIHLLFNILMLQRFGDAVERALGHLEWSAFCIAAAFVASGVELALFGQTGIGMSGVVYALIGLCWGARRAVPAFQQVANTDTLRFALGWIVITAVLTELGYLRVANGAHVGGLVFGLALAGLFVDRNLPAARRALAGAALSAVVVLAVLSVTYLPWNAQWRVWKATRPAAESAPQAARF